MRTNSLELIGVGLVQLLHLLPGVEPVNLKRLYKFKHSDIQLQFLTEWSALPSLVIGAGQCMSP